jgi:hypothetical protein
MGKLPQGQTESSKKTKLLAVRQKTLRPAAEFGFILPCGIIHQPSRLKPAAAA